MPIQLKRKNGQISPYRNSEYIPAYLFLPKELVDRAPPELQLPRRIDAYFTDWNVIHAVESDLFLELMMDSYAYMVWNHLGFKGLMEAYSGYAPEYIIAHSCGYWVQELLDGAIIPSVEMLYRSARHETFKSFFAYGATMMFLRSSSNKKQILFGLPRRRKASINTLIRFAFR